MAADNTLRTAVQRYCATIARDRLLVQAAGGNVSWKSGDTLWIKASGTWLADAEQKDIFVPVDLPAIHSAVAAYHFDYSPKVVVESHHRPSIETMLHALMPHRIVLHLHPVDAVAHLVRPDAEMDIHAAIGEGINWAWVPYHKPGQDLARAIAQMRGSTAHPDLIFMQNHGVILGGDTLDEIDKALRLITNRLRIAPPSLPPALIIEGDITDSGSPLGYRMSRHLNARQLGQRGDWAGRLSSAWAICPDHIVFLGLRAYHAPDLRALSEKLIDTGESPPLLFLDDGRVLERIDVTAAQIAQMQFYIDVISRQHPRQKLDVLTETDALNLTDWEAEKYRRSLSY